MSDLFNLIKKEISALSKIPENRQIKHIISRINMRAIKKAAGSKRIAGAKIVKVRSAKKAVKR